MTRSLAVRAISTFTASVVAAGALIATTGAAAAGTPTPERNPHATASVTSTASVQAPQPGDYRTGEQSRSRIIIEIDPEQIPNRKALNAAFRSMKDQWDFTARASHRLINRVYIVNVKSQTPYTKEELADIAADAVIELEGVVASEPDRVVKVAR